MCIVAIFKRSLYASGIDVMGKPEGENHSEDLGIDGSVIILKWFSFGGEHAVVFEVVW